MILSYKNRFIFIKNTKVAGTSIEIALASICGDKDIVTPISKKDELVRLEKFNSRCMNYSRKPKSENVYIDKLKSVINENDSEQKNRMLNSIHFPGTDESKFYNHMNLKTVWSRVDIIKKNEIINNNFILIYVCRDPYLQIISHAEFVLMNYEKFLNNSEYTEADIKENLELNLDDYINAVKKNLDRVKKPIFLRKMNDFILRYENLENDFSALLLRLNHIPIQLPHAKKSKRSQNIDIGYYFNEEQIRKINRELANYFALYNYPILKT